MKENEEIVKDTIVSMWKKPSASSKEREKSPLKNRSKSPTKSFGREPKTKKIAKKDSSLSLQVAEDNSEASSTKDSGVDDLEDVNKTMKNSSAKNSPQKSTKLKKPVRDNSPGKGVSNKTRRESARSTLSTSSKPHSEKVIISSPKKQSESDEDAISNKEDSDYDDEDLFGIGVL